MVLQQSSNDYPTFIANILNEFLVKNFSALAYFKPRLIGSVLSNISGWKTPDWNPILKYYNDIPDPENQHDLLKFDPKTMKVEVRYTQVEGSTLPKNGISYDFKTLIVLLNKGKYEADADINYKIYDGGIVKTSNHLMTTLNEGGYCQDSTTLQSNFADLITWDFATTGEFSKPVNTVTVDGTVGQFSDCGGGASSVDEQKEQIAHLGVNRVRVVVDDRYQDTQDYVKVEYRITSCKYLLRTI